MKDKTNEKSDVSSSFNSLLFPSVPVPENGRTTNEKKVALASSPPVSSFHSPPGSMLSRFPRWSVISCVLLIGTCCIVFASLVLKAREEHDAQASLVLWCSQRANVLTNYLYSVVRSANTYVSMASSPDCRFRTLDSFTVAENVSKLDLTVCT